MAEFEEIPIGTTQAELPPESAPAPASPAGPETIDTTRLADIQREKMDASRRIQDQTAARLEQDRQRQEGALAATGIQPGELPNWDQEQQAERFRTDPIEAFGSLGSVFAMVASAFTRQPMVNALNGSAAAMNAIRAGNEKEYTKAFEAWKANTDLTIKRHNIQNQYYQNSIKMLETNMSAGRANMEMVATRFGDERTLFLLNNGLDKEAIQLQASRADAISKMEEANQKITLNGVRQDLWRREVEEIDQTVQNPVENAGHKLQAFNRIYGKGGTPQQEAMGLLLHDMRGQPVDKIIERAQQLGLIPRAGGVLTRDRMGAEEIDRRRKQYEQENLATGLTPEQARVEAFQRATREVDTEMARMTGGQISQIEHASDLTGYSIQTIDRLLARIRRLTGPVGAPGYAQRGAEIVGNLLGGTDSVEYQQVAKDISQLRIWAGQVLTGRFGRLLASERSDLERVTSGLNLTDTTQNTIKTYEELRKLYAQIQRDMEARRTRTRQAPGTPGGTPTEAPPPPTRPPAWSDAPRVP